MTDESELNELRERIGKLRLGDQLHLFELVLGDDRRKYEDMRAELLKQQREILANEELQRALVAPFVFPPEAKREAG